MSWAYTGLEDVWRTVGARGETVNDGTSVGGGRGTEMEGVVDRECHWNSGWVQKARAGMEGEGGGGSRGHRVVGGRDDGLEPKGVGMAWGEEYSDWLREEASGRLW